MNAPAPASAIVEARPALVNATRFRAAHDGEWAQLDDILGERAPVNVPGTSTEYPNWRRKLGPTLDSLLDDERLNQLCSTLSAIREPSGA